MEATKIASKPQTATQNVLTLVRPGPGETAAFDADAYSRIDFQQILGQWKSLIQSGRSLIIVFDSDARIELTHFMSEGGSSSREQLAQIDDQTFLSPELFLQQYAATRDETVGVGSSASAASGAYFVDPVVPLSLSRDEVADFLLRSNPLIPTDDGFDGLVPVFVEPVVPLPTPPSNAAPVITSATATGDITEDVPPSAVSGTIGFSDLNLSDAHTVTATPAEPGYIGTFSATIVTDSTGTGTGQVTWNFSVDNAALQPLMTGEQLTQTYVVAISDGAGGTVSQQITVTITGVDGANGIDVLLGGAGNDVISGTAIDDIIDGGPGNDTLEGGGGANRFVYAEAGPANVDTIADYRFDNGDVIDLAGLLDESFGPASDVADFARLMESGSDIVVQIDADGAAGGQNWTDVAILSGYATSGADLVNVVFANTNHTLQA